MTDTAARIIAVTGTDTAVGKTIVTCALAARARQLGVKVVAMKPVETGVSVHTPSGVGSPRSDGERLRDAAASTAPMELIRPFALEEPLAPFVAAKRAGIVFELRRLDAARDALLDTHELLIVEGAGGLLVPLTATLSFAQLFSNWGGELVIVAGNRLGVLNHLLLTVMAAKQEGMRVRAIVLTALSERDPGLAEATNFDAIHALLPGYPVYRFPWVDRVDDNDALANAAEACGFDHIITGSARPVRMHSNS